MDIKESIDQQDAVEIKRIHQFLAKNIDDFKYLVLSSMRTEGNDRLSNGSRQSTINRVSDIQDQKTESLEEWVGREFASKPTNTKKELMKESLPTYEVAGETLEQWVARQKVKPKNTKSSRTVIDFVEEWLINEAKKDLFAEMNAKYTGSAELTSENVRELGLYLISLADKLDQAESRMRGI